MDKTRGILDLPIAESRINQVLDRIKSNVTMGIYATQEELSLAYADVARRLERGQEEAIYDLPDLIAGTPPSINTINLILYGIFNEAKYIIKATKSTGEVVSSNFNFAVSRIRKLQADLKYCNQQLGIYRLYVTGAENTDYFGESFSTADQIDKGSQFLEADECFLDLSEGHVTLPLLEEEDKWKIKSVQVSNRTNGNLGNNTEARVPVRGDIKALSDGNMDTWTEFERIVRVEDTSGLLVELNLSLDEVRQVNIIKISPVLLGARTPPTIDEIKLSRNGRDWIDIKGDVQVAEFLGEKPEEKYHLSPQSARFSGEFNISFPPRYAKFIKLLLRQTSAFSIVDTNDVRHLRYAIGIREIGVYGRKYKSSGDIISKSLDFKSNIQAVGLESVVDPSPLPEEVGKAEYYLSFDDGSSWQQLTTLKEASLTIPEVLSPPDNTKSLRYKIHLEKDESAFSKLRQEGEEREIREVHPWGDLGPLEINLRQKPIEGTISISDPEGCAVGKSYPKAVLGRGVYSELVDFSGGRVADTRLGATELRLKLPIPIEDTSLLRIYVNNKVWVPRAGVTAFTASPYVKQYYLSYTDEGDLEVVFGNDESGPSPAPRGKIPGISDEISMSIDIEENYPEGIVAPYTMKLNYPSDGEKNNTTIYFDNPGEELLYQPLPAGVSKHQLQFYPVKISGIAPLITLVETSSAGLQIQASSALGGTSPPGGSYSYQTFVDGSTEIPSSGNWTCDAKNGIVYINGGTSSVYRTEARYKWSDDVYLESTDWDFERGSTQNIVIYETGFHSVEDSASVTVNDLMKSLEKGIVLKSVRINGNPFGAAYIPYEIPFIDGIKEFEERAAIQDETVPQTTAGIDGIARFRLTQWQNIISDTAVFFSDETAFPFDQRKDDVSLLAIAGDWAVDLTGSFPGTGTYGRGYVFHYGSISSGGTVSYSYRDTFSSERMKGAYSVDTKEGAVYFAIPVVSTGTITFKYAPYKVRYNASITLEEETDYEVDTENKKITLLSGAKGGSKRRVSILYRYEPDKEEEKTLAPYFSPIVRAIGLRVAT